MATGIAITVAQNLFAVLKSQEFKEICDMAGYESQLDELAVTVSTIKAVLLDAECKHQELSHRGRDYIERLKDAVYDVDDLLDGFNTMVQREKRKRGGKVSKKVRRFISRSNQFLVAYNMSSEIKKLRNKLDKIAKDHQQFGFSDVYDAGFKRKETGSYTREYSIIGRDADKEVIMGMLLGKSEPVANIDDSLAFVSIVGMGGLGKTALAQLVYNDEKIKEAFEVRLWVCVSNEFGMEQICAKIVGINTETRMEELQIKVRKVIEGKRYLIVLDDVWEENRDKWVELRDFLMLGANGSKVLATSRSKKVAGAIENNCMYELQGLSEEKSWVLFKKIAFEQGLEPEDAELLDIGKEVVKKCANVPLSIRVVGSLLYKQNKSKWISFRNVDMRKLAKSEDSQAEDGIMPILKFSYYHLSPPLKSCFSYCALFPKDYEFVKTDLIWLWMAQGCLDLSDDERSLEDVGVEYFSILLHRCFFQENEETYYRQRRSFKMHDLIHDLAQEVAGKELMVWEASVDQCHKGVRHFSFGRERCKLITHPNSCLGEMKMLRTLLQLYDPSFLPTANESTLTTIFSNLRLLRFLNLRQLRLKSLPNTIGNLSHLRCLDLFANHKLEILPNSITKLHNLQVLNLSHTGIRELPKDSRELVNLRHLNLFACSRLTHMPAGMDSMTCLQMLSVFVVGAETSKHVKIGQLKDLKGLVNLKGTISIIFKSGFSYDTVNSMDLIRSVSLDTLEIEWEEANIECDSIRAVHGKLLESFRTHSDLRGIKIRGYKGIMMPSWAVSLTASLPCLVEVLLSGFDGLISLPSFSRLPNLKVLKLISMPNVEFIENIDEVAPFVLANSSVTTESYFPSLETLQLRDLLKLKGFLCDNSVGLQNQRERAPVLSFPRLKTLDLQDCPNMTAFPPCSGSLKILKLIGLNNGLTFDCAGVAPISNSARPSSYDFALVNELSHSSESKFLADPISSLENLWIDDVQLLDFLFEKSICGIHKLLFKEFGEVNLLAAPGLFQRHASCLKVLTLNCCSTQKNLSGGGLEHLTNLQSLSIDEGDNLDLQEDEMAPWKSLHSLSHLALCNLPKLVNLPLGLQYLTCIRSIQISNMDNLEVLPEWISSFKFLKSLSLHSCPKLTYLPEAIGHMQSLRRLRIYGCGGLTERCREPDGEDWPKICNVPFTEVEAEY